MRTPFHFNLFFCLFLSAPCFFGCTVKSSADGNFHPGVRSGNLAKLSISSDSSSSSDGMLTHHLGMIPRSSPREFELTITNSGQLEATAIQITFGHSSLGFKGGRYPGDAGDCATSLRPGASCRLKMTFTADSMGLVTETLQLEYWDGGEKKTLSARVEAQTSGVVQVTPSSVTAVNETSVSLQWSKPSNLQIHHYTVSVSSHKNSEPSDVLRHVSFDVAATSGTVDNLAPGSIGKIVLNAVTTDERFRSAPGVLYWTPFGAINEDSVSSVTWLRPGPGDWPELALFVSPNFTFVEGTFYFGNLTAVYDHVPTPNEKPTYNFAARFIRHQSGFDLSRGEEFSQVWSDGESKVAIATPGQHHRVVLYNHLPTRPENSEPAVILGQSNFTAPWINSGNATVHAAGLSSPGGVCFNGTTLYVADTDNHRILGWTGWPTATGQPANFVLGQPDFTQNTPNNGGVSKSSLKSPKKLHCGNGKLIAVDNGNHRVLIWQVAPTSNQPANIVVGQASGSASAANGAGGVSVGGLDDPEAATILSYGGNDYLLVADFANHRVVQFNALPTADGRPFDRVYTFNGYPNEVVTEAGTNRFWVATAPEYITIHTLNTDNVVSFDHDPTAPYEVSPGSYSTTRQPRGISWWGDAWGETWFPFTIDRLTGYFSTTVNVGAKVSHGRLWTTPPKDGNTPLDFVEGTSNPNSGAFEGWSPSAQFGEFSVVKVKDRIYWNNNCRIFSRPGNFDGNNLVPDVVLGSNGINTGVVAPTTYDYNICPTKLATDGNILYAADRSRVVGYHQTASLTTSNQPIDFAIGQETLLTNDQNRNGVSASSLYNAYDISVAEGKLLVSDAANHRVLIWNSLPTSTGVPADVIMGQTSPSGNQRGSALNQLYKPYSATIVNGKLVVADTGNGRVLIWNQIPTTSGTPADRAIDATTLFRFQLPSWYEWTELSPGQIAFHDNRWYLSTSQKILVIPDIF